MQEQRTADVGADIQSADEVARVILTVLLHRHPALVAIEELMREFDGADPTNRVVEMFVREGVNDLVSSGLAHRMERFAFASYSAVRAGQLDV